MRYHELFESKSAPLYRAVNLEYVGQMFRDDKLVGSTTQRYWDDGKRRKDNDPEYQNSNWMKGMSFTRDRRFAMSWGEFVMAVDQEKLAHRNKIIPFNWGYSIPSDNHHKREREEFVLTHKGGQYNFPDEEGGGFDQKSFRKPEGEIKGFDDMLLGFWLEIDLLTFRHDISKLEQGGTSVEELIKHPKFKGWYERPSRGGIKNPRFVSQQEVDAIIAERDRKAA